LGGLHRLDKEPRRGEGTRAKNNRSWEEGGYAGIARSIEPIFLSSEPYTAVP
jgi:hypothetical protein